MPITKWIQLSINRVSNAIFASKNLVRSYLRIAPIFVELTVMVLATPQLSVEKKVELLPETVLPALAFAVSSSSKIQLQPPPRKTIPTSKTPHSPPCTHLQAPSHTKCKNVK